jgi:ribonucleoside-diphosphate reductase alpha chain
MMDCDTTGVEPDIALVKYKSLAGGGMLKIVNRTVPMALRKLGYDDPSIRSVIDYIDLHDTIEGAPGLKDEHLPVFDCAFAPPQGGRSIHFRGHLRMMAAVQPFLSGAISKTVNMPAEATVDEIREAYLDGWKLGLKALAIYRDGSKGSQPVSTKAESDVATPAPTSTSTEAVPETLAVASTAATSTVATASSYAPRRERLPHTRRSLTHKFDIQGHEGYVNVGFYPDGRPGELFITMAKEGSTIGGLMDVLGTSISIGLQYGVPLEVFVNKFAHSRFEPAGFTKNPDIPIAKSIADYIFRWLGMEFIPGYREANAPQRQPDEDESVTTPVIKVNGHRSATMADLEHAEAVLGTKPLVSKLPMLEPETQEAREKQFAQFQSDAPACDNCGALTVRCGTCYRCFNCGNSMGCS